MVKSQSSGDGEPGHRVCGCSVLCIFFRSVLVSQCQETGKEKRWQTEKRNAGLKLKHTWGTFWAHSFIDAVCTLFAFFFFSIAINIFPWTSYRESCHKIWMSLHPRWMIYNTRDQIQTLLCPRAQNSPDSVFWLTKWLHPLRYAASLLSKYH